MSDESAPDVEEGEPQAPPTKTKLVRPAAPPRKPSRIKAYLMWFIILSTIGLTGAIGWKLVKKYVLKEKKGNVIDVEKEWRNAFDKAQNAHNQAIDVQAKTWQKGEALTPEDLDALRKRLTEMVDAHETLHGLFEKIRNRDAKEIDDIKPRLLRVRLWIVDAEDVVNGKLNATGMAGLYIPMNVIAARWKKAHEELQEIGKKKEEILQRNDPDERKRTREHLTALQGVFNECTEGYGKLVEYLKEEIDKELKKSDLDEFAALVEDQAMMNMAIRSARDLRADFRE